MVLTRRRTDKPCVVHRKHDLMFKFDTMLVWNIQCVQIEIVFNAGLIYAGSDENSTCYANKSSWLLRHDSQQRSISLRHNFSFYSAMRIKGFHTNNTQCRATMLCMRINRKKLRRRQRQIVIYKQVDWKSGKACWCVIYQLRRRCKKKITDRNYRAVLVLRIQFSNSNTIAIENLRKTTNKNDRSCPTRTRKKTVVRHGRRPGNDDRR